MEKASINTDKEIWRKVSDDYYSPSIYVTQTNEIGINVGGIVIVQPVEFWHEAGKQKLGISPTFKPAFGNTLPCSFTG